MVGVLTLLTTHSMHTIHYKHAYHSHIQGLKTGMYYLRTKPAANAIQFTIDQMTITETSRQL